MDETLGPDVRLIARKGHTCFFCGEACPKGNDYWIRRGVGGDGFWIMHMHTECRDATSDWHEWEYDRFEPGSMIRGIDEPR